MSPYQIHCDSEYALKTKNISIFFKHNERRKLILLQTYDAIVADVTILAERSRNVSFTQPYTESGLSLIFPAETEDSAWLIMKPFSWEIWIATIGILIYTMIIIWFLEHHLNPEFGGPVKTQISTTMWFAFSSLFFAHKEKINSNSARVVVGVWLFLVFVLTSSYTASLSSLLTVQKLRSDRDIEWLKQNNLSVGCANASTFVKDYLVQVHNFPLHQVVYIQDEHDLVDKFKNKKISAFIVESPYEKALLNKYCKGYTATTAASKFGGMGFVFQKGAPMAKDFSVAILTLAENGKLKALEDNWLTPNKECSSNSASPETESLTLDKFWGLYFICAATSTICLLLALLQKYFYNHNNCEEESHQLPQGNVIAEPNVDNNLQLTQGNVISESNVDNNHQLPQANVMSEFDDDNNNDLTGAFRNGTDLCIGNLMPLNNAATYGGSVIQGVRRRNSPRLENVSISDEPGNPQSSQSADIEMM